MKFKYYIIPLLASLMYSCGEGPDYTNVIPKNSAMVVAFDLDDMSEKGGLSGPDANEELLSKLEETVKSGLTGSEKLVSKIFDDTSESGLELEEKVYLFAGEQASVGGIVAKVNSRRKLEKVIDELCSQKICGPVQEADGCKWTVVGQWLLAYSKSAVVLAADNKGLEPENLVSQASMWLRQKEGEGFSASADFKQIQQKDGDIVAWTTLEVLPREVVYPLTMGVSAELQLKDVKAISTINFEKGKTAVDVETIVDDKIMSEIMEKKSKVTAPVKGTYLDLFPSKTDLWVTANLKGEEFFSFICENPTVRRIFQSSLIPVDFKSIFNAIDGDVAMSMDRNGQDFIVFADINSDGFLKSFESLKTMAAMTGGQVVLKNYGDNGYSFRTHDGSLVGLRKGPVSLWIGVKDNKLYLTNKESLIDRKVLGLSLRNREWGTRVTGQKFFMSSNLSSLNKLLDLNHLNGTMASALAFFGGLDYLTVESSDGKNIHIEILMKDKEKNPLTMIFN